MARPPTEAQVKFAEAIAGELCIKLPAIRTRQSMFLFIRDNRPKYDEVRKLSRYDCTPDPIDPDEDWYQMTAEGLDPSTGGFDDNY